MPTRPHSPACALACLLAQVEVCGMPMDCSRRLTDTAENSGRLLLDLNFDFVVTYPEAAILLVELKVGQLVGRLWS